MHLDARALSHPNERELYRSGAASLEAWAIQCCQCFGIDPAEITINISTEKHLKYAPILGFASEKSITIDCVIMSDENWICRDIGRRVVAHELAHVAQLSLSTDGVGDWPRECLEHEADLAAASAIAGQSFACKGTSKSDRVLNWNRFGHFYTTYYIACAVGYKPSHANRIALHCQLPDLVCELDAETQSLVAMFNYSFRSLNKAERERNTTTWVLRVGSALDLTATGEIPQVPHRSIEINRGLHSLTGNSARSEQNNRGMIAMNLRSDPTSLEFGLALHALGDAFAHTMPDNTTMYEGIMGHAIDQFSDQRQSTFDLDGFKLTFKNTGHRADNTAVSYDARYLPYITSLHRVLVNSGNAHIRDATKLTSFSDVESTLGRIAKIQNKADEGAQIPEIVPIIKEMCHSKWPDETAIGLGVPFACYPLENLPGQFRLDIPKLGRFYEIAQLWGSVDSSWEVKMSRWLDRVQRATLERGQFMNTSVQKSIYANDPN